MPTASLSPSLFGDLRHLAGLTLDEVAQRARLTVQEAREVELSWPNLAVIGRLASLYGLEAGPLSRGVMQPAADDGGELFLFSGAVTDLDPNDFGVFRAALQLGRAHVASAGRRGLAERQRHRPVAPTPPAPRHAARQGHLLARQVRASLGIQTAALDDFLTLFEERFGIAIRVARLARGLGAVGILDAGRAGAAVVLDAALPDRRRRVALAHELCHLMFDPSGADLISWSFDTLDVSERSHELKEARARGFAAEFLLPLPGLTELLGGPRCVGAVNEADRLAKAARQHFGTTWEITVNHLYNLTFLSQEAWYELLRDPDARAYDPPTTEVPPLGALQEAAADGTLVPDSQVELAKSTRAIARKIAADIRLARDERAQALVDECVRRAKMHPMQAAVDLATALDDAFERGDAGLVESVLWKLSMDLPADTLVMIMAGLRLPCVSLGGQFAQTYQIQVERVLDQLPRDGWSEEDVRDARETLR